MLKITTRNTNPNFTIILPGPCQAKCSFCYWKQDKNNDNFIKGLKKSLEEIPELFSQISISGGEPTISPFFKETLDIINEYKKIGKIQKVVLTTNGLNLKELDLTGINHINISRHSLTYNKNVDIFNTTKIPTNNELIDIVNHCNKFGIDVNFNVVFIDNVNTNYDINEWTILAKECNVSSITFRNQYGNYGFSKLESNLIENNYKPHIISSCPVCRTSTFFVNGVKIRFHSSDYEPTESKQFQEDEVYEVILQQNGNLTRDWEEKKIIINVNKEKNMEMPEIEYNKQSIDDKYEEVLSKIDSNNKILVDSMDRANINPNSVHASKLYNLYLDKNLNIILDSFEIIPLDSDKGIKLLDLMKELKNQIENNSLIKKTKLDTLFENTYKKHKEESDDSIYGSCGIVRPYNSCSGTKKSKKIEQEEYSACGGKGSYGSCG